MPKAVLVALICACCAAAGFAAATVLGAAQDSPPTEPGSLAGRPQSDSVDRVERDPQGEGPSWGLVVFTAANGQPCSAAGRTDGEHVGSLKPDGSVEPYEISEGASCVNLEVTPAGLQIIQDARAEGRTVVHGIAGPDVVRLTLTTPAGERGLELGRRRGFLAVLPPGTAISDLGVSAELRSGETRQLFGK